MKFSDSPRAADSLSALVAPKSDEGGSIGVRASGEVSNSIHIQAIARRSRELAIYIQEIASDIEEIGIYIMEIAADSRETGINWSEIATYSREIAADIQEMAANIGEIRIYTRRTAARSRGMATSSGILNGNPSKIKVLRIFSAKVYPPPDG